MARAVCVIQGCEKPSHTRGLCDMHRTRLKRHGSPVVARHKFGSPVERASAYIGGATAQGCIPWAGALSDEGYAVMSIRGRAIKVHQVLWEAVNGPIPRRPDGRRLPLDHLCHNADIACEGGPGCLHRRCLNLEHLEVTTDAINIRRGRASRNALGGRRGGE